MTISLDDFLDKFDPSTRMSDIGLMMGPSFLSDWIELMALITQMKPWSDVMDVTMDTLNQKSFISPTTGGDASAEERNTDGEADDDHSAGNNDDGCLRPIPQTLRDILDGRRSVLRHEYPFKFNDYDELVVKKGFDLKKSSYISMLGIALLHDWDHNAQVMGCYTKLFEHIVAEAFRKKGYDSGIVGTAQSGGGFDEKLMALGEELQIAVDPSAEEHSRYSNDEQVDVVAAQLFRDGRKGELFFITQVTCGQRERWPGKLANIPAPKWREYLIEYAQPFCYLAVPYHLTREAASPLLGRKENGSFLDRLRLTRMLGKYISFSDARGDELFKELHRHMDEILGLGLA